MNIDGKASLLARFKGMRSIFPNTWRDSRKTSIFANPMLARKSEFTRALNYWVCDEHDAAAWRDCGAAHEIARTSDSMRRWDHTGYYADDFQDKLYIGHVWQLPARNREPQYVAGFANPYGLVYLSASNYRLDIFDSREDAARAGDRLAEIMAEHARDYSAAWAAEQSARDDASQAFHNAREALAALREQKALGAVGSRVCSMLRAKFQDAHRAAREALGKFADARVAVAYADKQHARYAGRER